MKLLFVLILFFIFWVLKSGLGQDLKEDVTVAEPMPDQQEMIVSEYAGLKTMDWCPFCVFVVQITDTSVRGDIPDDHSGFCSGCISKFFKHNRSVLAGQMQALYSQKFMRLLSARHINGFYIYFLEKLII